VCRGSPGRYRTGRGVFASLTAGPWSIRRCAVEVGSGQWWFTLTLAVAIGVRLGVVVWGYAKRRRDRESP